MAEICDSLKPEKVIHTSKNKKVYDIGNNQIVKTGLTENEVNIMNLLSGTPIFPNVISYGNCLNGEKFVCMTKIDGTPYIKTQLTDTEKEHLIITILTALADAQEKYEFVHFNLISSNIIVKTTEASAGRAGSDKNEHSEFFKPDKSPVIIDFEFSRAKNPITGEIYDNPAQRKYFSGLSSVPFEPSVDVCKLLGNPTIVTPRIKQTEYYKNVISKCKYGPNYSVVSPFPQTTAREALIALTNAVILPVVPPSIESVPTNLNLFETIKTKSWNEIAYAVSSLNDDEIKNELNEKFDENHNNAIAILLNRMKLKLGEFDKFTQNIVSLILSLIRVMPEMASQVNDEGNTSLIWACYLKLNGVAMALIQTGQSKPEQINKNNNTALLWACQNKMNDVALALIQTGQSRPDHANNNTALMHACYNHMINVALALIDTGQSKPDHINGTDETALLIACSSALMGKVALALIQTGQSKPEHVNKFKVTALLWACRNSMSDVALALIQTGQSRPEQVSYENMTALVIACRNKMRDVALALIDTGQSKPEHVYNNQTALMFACKFVSMSNVALALIKTGDSKPEQVDHLSQNTALILACTNKLEDVALALIDTGKSVPQNINISGEDALNVAINNGLESVSLALIDVMTLPNSKKDYIMTSIANEMIPVVTKLLSVLPETEIRKLDNKQNNIFIRAIYANLPADLIKQIYDTGFFDMYQSNNYGITPVSLILQSGNYEWLREIIAPQNPVLFEENATGIDPIMHETVNVNEWLLQDPNNVAIRTDNKVVLTNINYMNDFYKQVMILCSETNNILDFSSTVHNSQYVYLGKLGLTIYVSLRAFVEIIVNKTYELVAQSPPIHVVSLDYVSNNPSTYGIAKNTHYGFNATQTACLFKYTHQWDSPILNYLRSGESYFQTPIFAQYYTRYGSTMNDAINAVKNTIECIDSAFLVCPVCTKKGEITLYRGVQRPVLPDQMVNSYISTSVLKDVAQTFAKSAEYVITIILDVGVPYISLNEISNYTGEDEILLPRGLSVSSYDDATKTVVLSLSPNTKYSKRSRCIEIVPYDRAPLTPKMGQ